MRDPGGEDDDQAGRRIDAEGGPALKGEPRLISIAAGVFKTKARIAHRVKGLPRPTAGQEQHRRHIAFAAVSMRIDEGTVSYARKLVMA